ncbi:MAG: hypothetical protein AAF555_07510 [Verrucomicrobiota bacterium]
MAFLTYLRPAVGRWGAAFFLASLSVLEGASWKTLPTRGECTARHEASMVTLGESLYLVGGRRKNPVDRFDLASQTWVPMAKPPLELHHFQAVVIEGRIAVIGAFTGKYPKEKPVPNIWFFDPEEDSWEKGPRIPKNRRRGAAGVAVVGEEVYLVAGIVNGHWDGFVPWTDRWNWKTGRWTELPDAPRARDHFHVAVIDGKVVAAGGRTTHAAVKRTFQETIAEVDYFDLEREAWFTHEARLPTPRAGCMAVAHEETIFVVGGESGQDLAHREVERFSFAESRWLPCPPLNRGRHGAGLAIHGGQMYVASGSGKRGGKPELDSVEAISVGDLLDEP